MTREEVLKVCYAAHTLAEVKAAQEARSQWLAGHPDDDAVRHMGEMLSMTEDALYLTGEPVEDSPASVKEPVTAKRS